METGLREDHVGITEYLGAEESFEKVTGIIKARYSDFNVQEIDLQGNVIRLTDLGPGISWDSLQAIEKKPRTEEILDNINAKSLSNNAPVDVDFVEPETELDFADTAVTRESTCDDTIAENLTKLLCVPQDPSVLTTTPMIMSESKREKYVVEEPMKENIAEYFRSVFPEDFTALQSSLIELIEKKSVEGESCILLPSLNDKSQRTNVHNFVKELSSKFNGVLVTDTINKDNIRISYRHRNSRKRKQNFDDRNHEKLARPSDFIICHLYKENKDTMECISRIASALRTSSKAISYAGTKDRRGITVQQLAISTKGGITIERLANLNKFLGRFQNIYLGNFRYSDTSFGLGDLAGNHFDIILRDVCPVSMDVEAFRNELEEFTKKLKSLLSQYGFINYFGMQRFGQSKQVPTYKIGIAVLKGEWKEAIELIMDPRDNERDAIEEARVLWKMTKQVSKALDMIPKRWVAERSILYHFSLPGVSMSDCLGAFQRIPHELRLMYLHSFQSLVWNQMVSYRLKTFGRSPVIGDLVIPKSNSKAEPKLTVDTQVIQLETEVDCRLYTLQDVVLPLPGYSATYPRNLTEEYQRLIESCGLDFSTFGRSGKHASITLAGSYRYVVCMPKNVSLDFIPYNDPMETLLKNDLDKFIRPLDSHNNIVASMKDGHMASNDSNVNYLALRYQFSLPSSAYATMAIREFLRTDTGAAYQRSLCPLPNGMAATSQ